MQLATDDAFITFYHILPEKLTCCVDYLSFKVITVSILKPFFKHRCASILLFFFFLFLCVCDKCCTFYGLLLPLEKRKMTFR